MDHPPGSLPHLTLQDIIEPSRLQSLYLDMTTDYYWSDDFSPEFYVAQAQAGFIAITEQHRGTELLLPELQFRYALLDFHHLHVSRHVRRILRIHQPILQIELNLHQAYSGIATHHTHSWFTQRYLTTLEAVNNLSESMKVISVLLRTQENKIVAGEIGYILGQTYTSLSGFSSRDPHFRHYGTTQLVLLGNWLKKNGFAFWNLGQPYMPYKFALGARAYSRSAFLTRWQSASGVPLPQSIFDTISREIAL